MTETLEVWCAGEEWCPITSTATLLGRKWHTVIVHRLLVDGPQGFAELEQSIAGISDKVLSESLEYLDDHCGIVCREVVEDRPVRVEYSLTERGESLEPVVEAMDEWGTEQLAPPETGGEELIQESS